MNPLAHLEMSLPLEKRAVWEQIKKANAPLLPAWASRGLTSGLVGAGAGGFSGFVGGVMDARSRGEDWGTSLREGGKRALTTGAQGALIGGGLSAAFPAFHDRFQNFGKGLLHTTTGWVPKNQAGKADLSLLGAGSHQSKQLFEAAKARGGLTPRDIELYKKEIAALEDAEKKGLTNLPGMVKGLIDPRRTMDTLRTSGKVLMDGVGTPGKVLLGVGAASTVLPAFADAGEDDQRTVGQRAFQAARGVGGMVLGAPLNAMTSQASSNPAMLRQMGESVFHSTLGAGAGRLLDFPASEVDRAWSHHRMNQNGQQTSWRDSAQYAQGGRTPVQNLRIGGEPIPLASHLVPVPQAYNYQLSYPTKPGLYHKTRVTSYGPVPGENQTYL